MKSDLGDRSLTSRPMRIVPVIPTLDRVRGGPSQVALRLAGAPVWMRRDVALAHPPPHASARGRSNLRCLPDRRRLPTGIRDDPDSMHRHSVWELLAAVAARARRMWRILRAIGPQGLLQPWSPAKKPIRERLAVRRMHGRLRRSPASLQALHRNERERIGRLDPGVPIAAIPNGVVAEALGSGLPVIAVATCHLPKVADRGAGCICPLDSAAVADPILGMVSRPYMTARMGGRGRDLVHCCVAWDAIARSLIDAYQDGIRSMGSRRP